jgi:AraC-like DNA-binding protein
MAPKLTGALYTYRTHALYVGPLIAAARHKHHAGQIMWVPAGVEVEGPEGPARRAVLHVVRPHEAHRHDAAPAAAVLWVDRDDLRWDRAQAARDTTLPNWGSRLEEPLEPAAARELAEALLALVAPTHEASACVPRHPAVKRMCALLDANSGQTELRVGEFARRAGLSVRQLRQRFTEELGINPSAYLRWRRLRRAIAAVAAGATLTEGALEGGFADGAHFSRVFQAQFGMAPSQAFSSVQFAGALDDSASGARF